MKKLKDNISIILSIGAVVTMIGSIFIKPSVSWGSFKTEINSEITSLKRSSEESRTARDKYVPIINELQIVVPRVEKKIESMDSRQTAFIERYDKNREEDQKYFRQLMVEVKK